jgi:hypothetical protein
LQRFSFFRLFFSFWEYHTSPASLFCGRVLSFKKSEYLNYPDRPSSAIRARTSSVEAILLGTFPPG